ncbi:DNA adenine methylase [Frondihabitans sucicola]|nr:DNA adenine methylase [Frondihabitans sucicola]
MPYFGGKQRIAQQIIDHFPPHEHYVEPFAGSLSVLLAKEPSRLETVNDLDGDIMTFWRVLRDHGDELMRAAALTPHSRAEYEASHDREGLDDLERARRVWVQITQGRAGQLTKTGWRHNANGAVASFGIPGYLKGYVERFADVIERLQHVSLECAPASQVIEHYGQHESTLIYADPPYPAEVRGGSRATNGYRHEMKRADRHRDLAQTLHAARGTVILSGYPCELYDDLYGDWDRVAIETYTGQANESGDKAARTEMLWSNRPFAKAVQLGFEFEAAS